MVWVLTGYKKKCSFFSLLTSLKGLLNWEEKKEKKKYFFPIKERASFFFLKTKNKPKNITPYIIVRLKLKIFSCGSVQNKLWQHSCSCPIVLPTSTFDFRNWHNLQPDLHSVEVSVQFDFCSRLWCYQSMRQHSSPRKHLIQMKHTLKNLEYRCCPALALSKITSHNYPKLRKISICRG